MGVAVGIDVGVDVGPGVELGVGETVKVNVGGGSGGSSATVVAGGKGGEGRHTSKTPATMTTRIKAARATLSIILTRDLDFGMLLLIRRASSLFGSCMADLPRKNSVMLWRYTNV